jgi:hypothetical protein
MSVENDGRMILTEEDRRTRSKTCPSANFSITNPTWLDSDANPGLRGERQLSVCDSSRESVSMFLVVCVSAR